MSFEVAAAADPASRRVEALTVIRTVVEASARQHLRRQKTMATNTKRWIPRQ